MANLLFLVFLADVLIYGASQYHNHGHSWADLVCSNTLGLCDYSQWLLLAVAPLFLATYIAHKNRST